MANQNKEQQNNEKLSSNAANEPTPIYLNDDSTLQTPSEDRHDKSIDTRKVNTFEPSNDDLHDVNENRRVRNDDEP